MQLFPALPFLDLSYILTWPEFVWVCLLLLAGEAEGSGGFYLLSLIPEVKHHQRTFL